MFFQVGLDTCFFLEKTKVVAASVSCICLWAVPPAAGQNPRAVPVVLFGADPTSEPRLCSSQCPKWSVNPTPEPGACSLGACP